MMSHIPNVLTASRIVLTGVFLYCFLSPGWGLKFVAVAAFLAASITDFTDGYLARKHNTVTAIGRFLDPLADKILTITAMGAFVMADLVVWWIVAVIVIRDIAITGLRIYAGKQGKQVKTTRLAKWKTMLQLVGIIIILMVWSLYAVILYPSGMPVETKETLMLLFDLTLGTSMILAVISGADYFLNKKDRYVVETS